jgi:hypothetical protein
MKKVFLILSLFCFVLFSQTVAQVAREYVEPSENYVLTKMTAGGENYWIINIDGKDEMLIDSTPKLIQNKNEITDIFITKFEEESMLDYKKEQTEEFIIQFQESQYPERTTCEQYTGVDKMPCYDKESCLKACYAVPICSMIKSEPFIYTILDWNILRNKVDDSFLVVYDDLENAETVSEYSTLRNSINTLKQNIEELEENGLYSVYGFCEDMSLSYDSLDSAESTILEIEESLSSATTVKNKANEIYAYTVERIDFINERNKLYTEIHVKVLDLFKDCESDYQTSKVYDENIEINLAVASTYIDDMLESKNEGNYKIAIDKGETYYSTLTSLKTDIDSLVDRRNEVDFEADNALETYEKSLPVLKDTKYHSNITSIKKEIERVKEINIVSNQLDYYKGRMIEFNENLEDMVSDCVLNGCEKILDEKDVEDETNESEVEVPIDLNDTEIPPLEEEEELPTTPSIVDSVIHTITSIIYNVLGRISRLFGN